MVYGYGSRPKVTPPPDQKLHQDTFGFRVLVLFSSEIPRVGFRVRTKSYIRVCVRHTYTCAYIHSMARTKIYTSVGPKVTSGCVRFRVKTKRCIRVHWVWGASFYLFPAFVGSVQGPDQKLHLRRTKSYIRMRLGLGC